MASYLHLLGHVRLESGGVVYEIPVDKRGCLLVYLAYRGDWVSREKLAFLFWPDTDEKSARRNLRRLLNRVKELTYVVSLDIKATRLRWPIETDVASFRRALGRQAWSEATTLYVGELLAGFIATGASGFETWLELERESLRNASLGASFNEAKALAASGQHSEAAELFQHHLDEDELAEDVLQSYLRSAYLAGQREAALARYGRFKDKLREELCLEPLEETRAIVAAILTAVPLEADWRQVQQRENLPLPLLRPPKLVGRVAEIHQVQRATASVLLLYGEAGIGKSRLLAELAPGALAMRCQEGLQAVPYQPVTGLVRTLLGRGIKTPELGDYLEDLARLVPEVAPALKPGPADAQAAKGRLLEAISRYFEGLAPAEHRFQLTIDDLQWADPTTLELLVFLGVRRRLRVLGSYRSHEVSGTLGEALAGLRSSGSLELIELEPLAYEAVQDLLATLTGRDAGPPRFSRWLHARTGGNPLFALETLKSLFERGDLRIDAQGWHTPIDDLTEDYGELDVPPAIFEVIGRRVSALSEPTRRALQAASVIGEGFDHALLSQIAGLSEWAALETLEAAEAAKLIEGGRFRHDLLRQTVYRALPEGRRRLLHSHVAEALEASGDPSVVAEHWLAAGHASKAAELWRQLAAQLVQRGVLEAAEAYLRRSIDHTPTSRERDAARAELARVLLSLARFEEAGAAAAAILGSSENASILAVALNVQAELALHRGDLELAALSTAKAIALAEEAQDEALLLDCRINHALVAVYQGRGEEVRSALLIAAQEVLAAPPAPRAIRVLSILADHYDAVGEPEAALVYAINALEIARALGLRHAEVRAANDVLGCYLQLGRAEEGLVLAREALALGTYDSSDLLRHNLARACFELCQDDEAILHSEALAHGCENPSLQAMAFARLAELYARTGKSSQVMGAVEGAIAALAQTDYSRVRVRVVTSILRHGTDDQVQRISPYLTSLDTRTSSLTDKQELEQALALHGV